MRNSSAYPEFLLAIAWYNHQQVGRAASPRRRLTHLLCRMPQFEGDIFGTLAPPISDVVPLSPVLVYIFILLICNNSYVEIVFKNKDLPNN
jgi:hypothetical protein